MNSFVLTDCTLLTMDENNSFYENGFVSINDGKIEMIGDMIDVPRDKDIVSMKGKIVLPGLINCHNHLPSSLYRGMGSDLALMDWLNLAMWPAQKFMSEEHSYWGSFLNCLESIRNGVTTVIDQYYYANSNAKAVVDSGMRAVIGATVFDHSSPEGDNTLQIACDFIEKYKGNDRIYPCFGPHAPYTESPETYKKIAELAKKYRVQIHTHIGETKDEVAQIKERYNTTSTKLLESVGTFEVPVISAHNVYIGDEDVAIFAKYGVLAAYNPVSNLKLASGIANLKPLIEAGVTIGIGTDGVESNNTADLLADLKVGTLLQKTINEDATFIKAESALRMATSEAAKVAGIDSFAGQIKVGFKADLIAIDRKYPSMTPIYKKKADEIYAAIVYAADGRAVSDTIVDGKFLMKEREILAFDERDVLINAQRATDYIVKHSKIYN